MSASTGTSRDVIPLREATKAWFAISLQTFGGPAGQIAVTGAYDKTLRVWSLLDGALLRTIRMPAGPEIGKIYAVAMSPDGALVAAGGWTQWTTAAPEDSIYVFETRTGKMTARIGGVPGSTHSLAFSRDEHRIVSEPHARRLL